MMVELELQSFSSATSAAAAIAPPGTFGEQKGHPESSPDAI